MKEKEQGKETRGRSTTSLLPSFSPEGLEGTSDHAIRAKVSTQMPYAHLPDSSLLPGRLPCSANGLLSRSLSNPFPRSSSLLHLLPPLALTPLLSLRSSCNRLQSGMSYSYYMSLYTVSYNYCTSSRLPAGKTDGLGLGSGRSE